MIVYAVQAEVSVGNMFMGGLHRALYSVVYL